MNKARQEFSNPHLYSIAGLISLVDTSFFNFDFNLCALKSDPQEQSMKLNFLFLGCLFLSACTTHYNDQLSTAHISGATSSYPLAPQESSPRHIPIQNNHPIVTKSSEELPVDDSSVRDWNNVVQPVTQEVRSPVTVVKSRSLETVNQDYLSAARVEDNERVLLHLNEGANVNAANGHGETVLHMAAASGNYQLATTVLNAGANVNALTTGGWTALHSAARFGHLNIVDLLLQAGVDRYAVNRDGKSAFDLARQVGNADIVSRLSQ